MHSHYYQSKVAELDKINEVIEDRRTVLKAMIKNYDFASSTQLKYILAEEGLSLIRLCKPFSAAHIEAMLSIPAIVQEWELIMAHPSLKNMSKENQRTLQDALLKLSSERKEKISALKKEIQCLDVLQKQMQPTIPELAKIKSYFADIISGRYSAESNDKDFTAALKLIFNSNDVETTLDAAVKAGESMGLSWLYLPTLQKYQSNKDMFNYCLDVYRDSRSHVHSNSPRY